MTGKQLAKEFNNGASTTYFNIILLYHYVVYIFYFIYNNFDIL